MNKYLNLAPRKNRRLSWGGACCGASAGVAQMIRNLDAFNSARISKNFTEISLPIVEFAI
jgi:hypothetical protein